VFTVEIDRDAPPGDFLGALARLVIDCARRGSGTEAGGVLVRWARQRLRKVRDGAVS
jgi:hypothetical protein